MGLLTIEQLQNLQLGLEKVITYVDESDRTEYDLLDWNDCILANYFGEGLQWSWASRTKELFGISLKSDGTTIDPTNNMLLNRVNLLFTSVFDGRHYFISKADWLKRAEGINKALLFAIEQKVTARIKKW